MERRKVAQRLSINNMELITAAVDGKHNLLEYYINEGADVNYQDGDGNTALHWAVKNGELKVIKVLLHNRAKNLKNNQNETPISLAKDIKKWDALKMLESALNTDIMTSGSKLQTAKVKHDENQVEPNTNITSALKFNNGLYHTNYPGTRKDGQTRKQYQSEKTVSAVHGNIYQLKVLMLFLIRGLSRRYNFRLGTEIKEANKFDDLVFEYTERDGKKVYRLLQAKHKLDESKKISAVSLLVNNTSDYSLIKYFRSYENCKRENQFKNGEIKDVTVYTNIDFNFKSLQSVGIAVRRIESSDDIFDVKSKLKQSARYKFDKSVALQLTRNLKSTSIDEVCDFLDHLVFAVNQPNEDELETIIKQEIEKEFDFVTTENVYNKLFMRMLNWLQGKEGGRYISYEEGEQFFREAERRISVLFDTKTPVKSFIGRVKELDDLHIMLQDNSEMPQLACIRGDGGTGKTELARKYMTLYCDYYDNHIIWINADCYTSLTAAFRRLASDKLKINTKDVNGQEKQMRSIVDDVYDFFSKRKSLFIFDHVIKSTKKTRFNGLAEFLPSVPSKATMLHILFTSRSEHWPPHMKVLELNVFAGLEATDFLKNSLEIKTNTQMIEMKELAAILGFMPLALQQAVSYINECHTKLKNLQSQFTIEDYLNFYFQKMNEISGFNFFQQSGSSTQVVLTTCNVTLDLLSQMKHRKNALDILNIASYLASQNIPMYLFSKLLPDSDQLESAISFLSKYSLIEVKDATFTIQKLVQQIVRMNLIRKGSEPMILGKAVGLLNGGRVNREAISHMLSLWNHSQKYTELVIEFSKMSSFISHALLENNMYEEAYWFGQGILKTMRKLSNSEALVTVLATQESTAMSLQRQGRHDIALKILHLIFDIQKCSGLHLVHLLNTKCNIALTLFEQGKHKDAFQYYKEVFSYENILYTDHPLILRARNGIATVSKCLMLKNV